MNSIDPYKLVAPRGTEDAREPWAGRQVKKPWDYAITAAIPHLDTLEPLKICLEVLRMQTLRPYLMVIDTGSPPEVFAEVLKLRAEDCEIHQIAAHGWKHTSEPVAVALDNAQQLCRSKLMFHTHVDCFLRRADFLETFARICNANTPVVGYRMSPRDWATDEWEWMVGHTALLLYMPSIHRAGLTWSMERANYAYGMQFTGGGWPDTETGFNYALRDAGIKPVFIGFDRNHERQVDDNLDHARSYPGSKLYGQAHSEYHARAAGWMKSAMQDANERVHAWKSGIANPPDSRIPQRDLLAPYY